MKLWDWRGTRFFLLITLVSLDGIRSQASPGTFHASSGDLSILTGAKTEVSARSATLAVTVSTPTGRPATVKFYGRKAPQQKKDFTIVALPDTQGYSESPLLAPLFSAQTRWIAESRSILNTVFVTHLGDVTEFGDREPEWVRADSAMRVLDDSGIPYNLSPGNHDMGAEGTAALFDKYFPIGRFLGKPWYGGYLGRHAGEPDRGNKNNFELFSVGSLNFIVIHLEPDFPTFAVAWADRLLKQYADRRAVLSTHIYLDALGNRPMSAYYRPDGISAEQAWQELIRNNCNVFMVLNGHYHGQARRIDLNRCGDPVFQIVQDYQDRPNGGDGWLRYFTFRPADNRIDAYTFSPSLNAGAGEFETDPDGQFSLRYEMGGEEFSQIGLSGGADSGKTVVIEWPGLDSDSEYEWYVTVEDGQSTVQSPRWNFRTASSVSVPSLSVEDIRVRPGSHEAVFTVSLSEPGEEDIVVGFSTNNGTATAGADYIPSQGMLRFGPGEVTKKIRVQILGSAFCNGGMFSLILHKPANAAMHQATGTCTIQSDRREAGPHREKIP